MAAAGPLSITLLVSSYVCQVGCVVPCMRVIPAAEVLSSHWPGQLKILIEASPGPAPQSRDAIHRNIL